VCWGESGGTLFPNNRSADEKITIPMENPNSGPQEKANPNFNSSLQDPYFEISYKLLWVLNVCL